MKHNYDREGGCGDHIRVKTDSPVFTSDSSIRISISISISIRTSVRVSANQRALMLMSTMSSLNISISLRRKLMLMPMSRLSSLAHKLLMLTFILMLASLVRTGLTCFPPVLFFKEISTFYIQVLSLRRNAINTEGD